MEKAELVSTEIYKELFESYLPGRLVELYSLRPENELAQFFKISQEATMPERKSIQLFLEIIISDVASTILGGLDGITDLGSLSEDFKVEYNASDVTGELQEHFLAKIEERYTGRTT